MKKYFLTTALMGTFIAPAFGADKIITSANTCTVDVLGVSDNNAVANTIATWDLIDYTLNPGQYLNVTETSVDKTICPAGSYCVGGGYTVETADNSIAQCPTGYPNSADGASADTQCYTACTVTTANIAHATAVSGNDYYGTGTDTCGATACETGYHVDGGGLELVEKDPLIPVDYTVSGNGYAYIGADGDKFYKSASIVPEGALSANGTWASVFDYGVIYGKASCQPQRNPLMEYIMTNFELVASGDMTIEAFKSGLEPLAGASKAEFAAGIITDVMSGTKSEEDMLKALYAVFMTEPDANYSTDSTGLYCYCQMDGFAPMNGDVLGTKEIVVSAPWVLHDLGNNNGFVNNCFSGCAYECAYSLYSNDNLAFSAAVVGALGYTESGGICAANTINIDWNPDNGGAHTQNMCTYDGEITLPTPDPVKPGYTFTGWKLVE